VEIYVVDGKTIQGPRHTSILGVPGSSNLQFLKLCAHKFQVFFQKLQRKVVKARKESSASHVPLASHDLL
jgi:hypothetical protein